MNHTRHPWPSSRNPLVRTSYKWQEKESSPQACVLCCQTLVLQWHPNAHFLSIWGPSLRTWLKPEWHWLPPDLLCWCLVVVQWRPDHLGVAPVTRSHGLPWRTLEEKLGLSRWSRETWKSPREQQPDKEACMACQHLSPQRLLLWHNAHLQMSPVAPVTLSQPCRHYCPLANFWAFLPKKLTKILTVPAQKTWTSQKTSPQ